MVAEAFVVQPSALHGYSGLLERNTGYLRNMREYLDGAGNETKGLMGVMFIFQQMAEDLARWQRTILDELTRKLADTTTGLRQTADSYARTDAASAAELDKTMPTAPDDGRGPGRGAI